VFASLKQPDVVNYVTLEFKLMNWGFLDFSLRVPTDTHLFTVKKKLEERHGRIRDLVVCMSSYAEKNEMTDDVKTLDDYGIKGAPDGAEQEATQLIFYEFKPCDHDDPLLLHLSTPEGAC